MKFSLHESEEAGHTVLRVTGEVDVYTASGLRDRMAELLDEHRNRLAVDLDGVEFLDSTGLGVLVAGTNRAQESGGALTIVCCQQRILKLFRITGLDEVLTTVPHLDPTPSAH